MTEQEFYARQRELADLGKRSLIKSGWREPFNRRLPKPREMNHCMRGEKITGSFHGTGKDEVNRYNAEGNWALRRGEKPARKIPEHALHYDAFGPQGNKGFEPRRDTARLPAPKWDREGMWRNVK